MSLTPTSYVVLGLVGGMGPCTPYDMKQMVGTSIGYFWQFPPSQLYAEADRLAGAGLLEVEQEGEGRRRKRYTITPEGLEALHQWIRRPSDDPGQTRYPGLLQLFFGAFVDADAVVRLAQVQAEANQEILDTYQAIDAAIKDDPTLAYPRATLRLGMKVAQACLEFWEEIAEDPPPNVWGP